FQSFLNDPDLDRPTPDIVDQARVVLAIRKEYQKGLSHGVYIGMFLGFIFSCIGLVISRVL
ncbi:hypothetical protein, partial [Pseudomonas cannabina]|uniref:hypothetical protein n=1 Tax=Pseudomonas cannabina TaxID=86840 RepID=UPI001C809EEA